MFVREEGVKEADRVRTAANTRDEQVGQASFGSQYLLAGFLADDFVKVANHLRIRMRAENGAEKIMRRRDVCHPVAHRFIDRIFQRAAAGIDANHFGAEKQHAIYVEPLPLHIFGAHVNGAR